MQKSKIDQISSILFLRDNSYYDPFFNPMQTRDYFYHRLNGYISPHTIRNWEMYFPEQLLMHRFYDSYHEHYVYKKSTLDTFIENTAIPFLKKNGVTYKKTKLPNPNHFRNLSLSYHAKLNHELSANFPQYTQDEPLPCPIYITTSLEETPDTTYSGSCAPTTGIQKRIGAYPKDDLLPRVPLL